MNLSALLKKYDLHPKKGLGQNFLTDPIHLQKIVDAADLTSDDTVLEIGPGPGVLTERLCEAAGQVIAVELDSQMVQLLRAEYGHHANLTVVEADILQLAISDLQSGVRGQEPGAGKNPLTIHHSPFTIHHYKVVANLPYYITSAVLRHLLESAPRPQRIVVTVQKEVAERIVAQPGQMSLLAVSVQFYGAPKLVQRIPAGAFYPPPKVDSAVVRIDTFAEPPLPPAETEQFFRVVKAGFGQKRKQLKNTLSAGLHLPGEAVVGAMTAAGIEPSRRAQSLSIEEWLRLARALRDN
ncbi:MAG: 16S rRNA (adenine(1518)-N(6)/adenine(1519)-N(6)) -dimethyltransferase RsmA [Anaerolineae bacterium]